ncbi:hypothetical protein HFP70_35435 [Streptomyces sp. ARC14]|uniref:hypothetical protein n=1 Tax=Streptomyces sp. ARC14 TaxID=2724152 RepID=UPI00385730EB
MDRTSERDNANAPTNQKGTPVSAYLAEIIKGLNKNARTAITATAAATDGRVPNFVHDRTIDALHRRKLIREVTNRNGGFNWCVLTTLGKRVAAELAARAANRQPAQRPAPAAPARRRKPLTDAQRTLQYADATLIFGALHPAAAEIVKAYQQNALDTVVEGGPFFSPADVWGQIGAEPGQRLAWNAEDDPDEWATADGFNAAWAHLDRLATNGELNASRWGEMVTAARDVMRTHSVRTEPVVMTKESRSWQVLFAKESPLTGAEWADFPVVSVHRTARLRSGDDWHVVNRRLDAAGLARYGVIASSAGHALHVARARWETEGPHSAWFAFLSEDAELIESVRAQFNPTPEQEREAFARLTDAITAAEAEAGTVTLPELHAIASGQSTAGQD